MDFRHLIVTCLFSMLRLPFDNQKVKENYAIFINNTRMFYPKTWGCFAPLHPDVLGENMGMFWVLTPIL